MGDPGSIPGSGRFTGEGNSNPLQYSCLENPIDEGTRQATVHGVAKSWTEQLHFLSFQILKSNQPTVQIKTPGWERGWSQKHSPQDKIQNS